MKQATKAAPFDVAAIGDLRAKVAGAEATYEAKAADVAALQKRFNDPLPDDNSVSLAAVDEQLRIASRDLVLARRDHELAVAAVAAAEKEEAAERDRRLRQELTRRLDEAVATVPPAYRRLAGELLALVESVHRLDCEIVEYNKRLAPGGEGLATFEQRVRWPARDAKAMVPFIPARLSDEFEVAALQRGDNFRIAGTYRPGGGLLSIWYDANGRPRSN